MKQKLLLIPLLLALLLGLALGAHAQESDDYPFLSQQENQLLKEIYAKIDALLEQLDKSPEAPLDAQADPKLKEIEALYQSIEAIEQKIEEKLNQDKSADWDMDNGYGDETDLDDADEQMGGFCEACGAPLDCAWRNEDEWYADDEESADDTSWYEDEETVPDDEDETDDSQDNEAYVASLTFLTEEERSQLLKAYNDLDALFEKLITLEASDAPSTKEINALNQQIDSILEAIAPIEEKVISHFQAV